MRQAWIHWLLVCQNDSHELIWRCQYTSTRTFEGTGQGWGRGVATGDSQTMQKRVVEEVVAPPASRQVLLQPDILHRSSPGHELAFVLRRSKPSEARTSGDLSSLLHCAPTLVLVVVLQVTITGQKEVDKWQPLPSCPLCTTLMRSAHCAKPHKDKEENKNHL